MKLITGILAVAITLTTGAAWAQNPDAIDNARSTVKSLQQIKTNQTNAALAPAGQPANPQTAKPGAGSPAKPATSQAATKPAAPKPAAAPAAKSTAATKNPPAPAAKSAAAPATKNPPAPAAKSAAAPAAKSAPAPAAKSVAAPAAKSAPAPVAAKAAKPHDAFLPKQKATATAKVAAKKPATKKPVATSKIAASEKPAVNSKTAEAAKAPKPEEKKWAMNGKRDPFFSPVSQGTTTSGCSTGKKCLEIGQINVRGVVKSESGFVAVVTNSLNKAYFLHENDPVFNGYVVKITGDSVVFQETFQDKLGKSLTREVVKRILTPAV